MPSITFVLPHWLYWSGLILVPAIGMYMVRRQKNMNLKGVVSKRIAYFLWLWCGFTGMHRLYLKDPWGLVYVPVFILLMLLNVQHRTALDSASLAKNDLNIAQFDVEMAQEAVKKDKESAPEKLKKAQHVLETVKEKSENREADVKGWTLKVRLVAWLIALFLIIDAFLIPKLFKKCIEKEKLAAAAGGDGDEEVVIVIPGEESQAHETLTGKVKIDNKLIIAIDKLNGYVAEFVCFWSLIAVFVYYFEVLARYVFNSPTNWAHEGMFLMFGMQYVLAAGYDYHEGAMVHVDVIYRLFPTRVKAAIDIFTFIFFLIFVVALIGSGYIFAADSIRVMEVSFTEWAIQYWPVKLALPIGAFLLLIQGLTMVAKDFVILFAKKEIV